MPLACSSICGRSWPTARDGRQPGRGHGLRPRQGHSELARLTEAIEELACDLWALAHPGLSRTARDRASLRHAVAYFDLRQGIHAESAVDDGPVLSGSEHQQNAPDHPGQRAGGQQPTLRSQRQRGIVDGE